MLDTRIRIGTQKVHLAQPYGRPASSRIPLVGCDAELRLVASAWLALDDSPPMSPLLVGEPGVGKNRIVYEAAERLGAELYILQGHEDVTPEDLAATARIGEDGGVEYVASPLATAMLRGGICFLDEIGKLRPRALALLASALDERRYVDSILLGERIHAAPGFRFVAATNTADIEGSMLPDYVRSRLAPVVHVRGAGADEIAGIVRGHFRDLGDQLAPLLAALWESWRKAVPSRSPSPRDAISVFAMATRLAGHDRAARISADHVASAVSSLFGSRAASS